MDNNSISVTQFCTYIKQIFDAEELLHGISIYGEISGFSLIRGNAYFTIKDDLSSLQCVFFGYNQLPLSDGEKVIIIGSPNFYAKTGKLSFNVFRINQIGKGELYLQFLLLKEKLEKEGLFDAKNKKQLPSSIKKIGVVTSKEGAVLQDIINVTSRRNPFVTLVVYPARVQGKGAAQSIIKGINQLNKTDVDVIIVARGGGSAEDLSCFNDEKLARAVYESQKPIISAVGHEVDFTIIDFVADVRASTPSVAAEFVTKDVMDLYQKIQTNEYTIKSKVVTFLNKKSYLLDNKIMRITYFMTKIVKCQNIKFENQKSKLKKAIYLAMKMKEDALKNKKILLSKLNPVALLERGYAKIQQNGHAVVSSKEIDENCFDIIFKDGKITAKKVNE